MAKTSSISSFDHSVRNCVKTQRSDYLYLIRSLTQRHKGEYVAVFVSHPKYVPLCILYSIFTAILSDIKSPILDMSLKNENTYSYFDQNMNAF